MAECAPTPLSVPSSTLGAPPTLERPLSQSKCALVTSAPPPYLCASSQRIHSPSSLCAHLLISHQDAPSPISIPCALLLSRRCALHESSSGKLAPFSPSVPPLLLETLTSSPPLHSTLSSDNNEPHFTILPPLSSLRPNLEDQGPRLDLAQV
jgi:hypothetical protein